MSSYKTHIILLPYSQCNLLFGEVHENSISRILKEMQQNECAFNTLSNETSKNSEFALLQFVFPSNVVGIVIQNFHRVCFDVLGEKRKQIWYCGMCMQCSDTMQRTLKWMHNVTQVVGRLRR